MLKPPSSNSLFPDLCSSADLSFELQKYISYYLLDISSSLSNRHLKLNLINIEFFISLSNPIAMPSSLNPIPSPFKKWHHHLPSCSGQQLMSHTWFFSCPQYLVFISSPSSVGLTSKIYSQSISLSHCYCYQEFFIWIRANQSVVYRLVLVNCFWPAMR